MKLSLMDIIEGFFHPEVPGGRNTHHTPHAPGQKGPDDFPYTDNDLEMMSDEDIKQELKLELKLGNIMRDPLNMPAHNVQNGSFSWGKASKPFGNFQTKTRQAPTKSQVDVAVNGIEEELDPMHDPETEELYRKKTELQIIDASSKTPEEVDEATKRAIENRDRARRDAVAARKKRNGDSKAWEKATSETKYKSQIVDEDVGMREKALAYGSPVQTTKQPFANGVPNRTGSDFMDEEEIMRELGLMEWINSSSVFNRHASGETEELEFMDDNRPLFTLNTEEEFNKNQKKMKVANVKEAKRQKK
jgi:hypothetical protein